MSRAPNGKSGSILTITPPSPHIMGLGIVSIVKVLVATFQPPLLAALSVNKMTITKRKSSAFTLIELLVVISIIGILSSTVLASLNQARIKARNSAINSQVEEYRKALELYFSDHDEYPWTNPNQVRGIAFPPMVCLGGPLSLGINYCSYSAGTFTSILLEDALSKYISSYPPITKSQFSTGSGPVWRGATYDCPFDTWCRNPKIVWYLQGENQPCGIGTQELYNEFPGYTTICGLTLGQ